MKLPLCAVFPLVLGLPLACSGSAPVVPEVEGELVFVRGGIVSPAGEGQALPGGSVLVERPWAPGEQVELDGLAGVAPKQAECLTLFRQGLGDVSRMVAMGGSVPNTALAWSPDGASRLAVGTARGEVLVLDGWTGEVLARRRLAETLVKGVAWSPDGTVLYAAEQSPDATLRALDPGTLKDRWTLRLAELVGSSPAPDAEDIYGIYTLPAAYGLEVLPGGELFLTALHSWKDASGTHLNRSQALRVSPEGKILDRWPEAPADATFTHPRVDAAGGVVAFTVNRSADGPAPSGLPLGGVQVLTLDGFQPLVGVVTEPLLPHFASTFIWEAVGVDKAQDALLMGFGDGRVRVVGLDGAERLALSTGAPVMAGEVPIHASVGWGFLQEGGIVFNTSNTLIPWGAASAELRPPSTHPAENTVHAVALDGSPRWSFTSEHQIQGLTPSPDGSFLVVGAGDRSTDERRDLYGALVLDLSVDSGLSGPARLRAVCPTEGPVFFRHAVAPDGRIAVAEHPTKLSDESIEGAYRVTVLR